ncbi:hypothetical protein CRENBAI_008425 [Crenichthys baileyi]|uniref:Secreted protein n=1 Tax=Crenichthys baileyi TaxID=28760 RepID=A0AAV9RF53_9TELE
MSQSSGFLSGGLWLLGMCRVGPETAGAMLSSCTHPSLLTSQELAHQVGVALVCWGDWVPGLACVVGDNGVAVSRGSVP